MEILQISDLHLRGDGKLSFRKVDTPACLRTAAAYLHTRTAASMKNKNSCCFIVGFVRRIFMAAPP